MRILSKYFVNGMLVVVPVTITIMVITGLVRGADTLIGSYFAVPMVPGIGVVSIVGLILFAGWFSTHWFTRKFVEWGERILGTIPIVKTIYSSVKQMSAAVFDSSKLLQQAVLVPYPHPGVQTLGFIMSDVEEPLKSVLPEDAVCVYIPASINMTAGFNIFVPRKDVIRLNITSESALQYVLTAGASMPRAKTDGNIR